VIHARQMSFSHEKFGEEVSAAANQCFFFQSQGEQP
jgi:hypothetical protein